MSATLSDLERAYARMMKKVIKEPGDDGCWLWTGSTNKPVDADYRGHGQVRIKRNGKWKKEYVHRLTNEMFHGPIPPGIVIRHKCDNSLCVRDDHHKRGTGTQNHRDMVERGRLSNQYGPCSVDRRTNQECPF